VILVTDANRVPVMPEIVTVTSFNEPQLVLKSVKVQVAVLLKLAVLGLQVCVMMFANALVVPRQQIAAASRSFFVVDIFVLYPRELVELKFQVR